MTDEALVDGRHEDRAFHFDRHTPQYRDRFQEITSEMHQHARSRGPTPTAGTGWLRATEEVFELARCPHVSNDHDIANERRGYTGITIPRGESAWRSAAASWRWMNPSTGRTAPR